MRSLIIVALLATAAVVARARCETTLDAAMEECNAIAAKSQRAGNAGEMCDLAYAFLVCSNTRLKACSSPTATYNWDVSAMVPMWESLGCANQPQLQGLEFSAVGWGHAHYQLARDGELFQTCNYPHDRQLLVGTPFAGVWVAHGPNAAGNEGKVIGRVMVEFKFPSLPTQTLTWTPTSSPFEVDTAIAPGVTVGPNGVSAPRVGLAVTVERIAGSLTVGVAGRGALGGYAVDVCSLGSATRVAPELAPAPCQGMGAMAKAACAYDAKFANACFAVAAATSFVSTSAKAEAARDDFATSGVATTGRFAASVVAATAVLLISVLTA